MNQQNIKKLLVLIVIGLSICLLFTTFHETRQRLASGIIMMQQIDITANVGGNIKNVYCKQGDTVKYGDILYEIDSQELTEEITKAQQAVAKIEDDLRLLSSPNTNRTVGTTVEETVYQQAAAKAQQYQELYEQGAISRIMLQQAQAQRDAAYQAMKAARSSGQANIVYDAGNPTVIAMKQEELAYAKKNLETLEEQKKQLIVISPADGILSNQIYQNGQRVEKGYLLAGITVKENCTIAVYVTNEQRTKLTEGQEVEIVIGTYPDKQFSGIIETIGQQDKFAAAPAGENQILVQIRMKNEENLLRAGMQAEIYIK